MLFAVLARGFGLPVRAAMVPTHVFIEMGAPGQKIIEVETTSATGFDWVHDERFYKEAAAQWSSNRGLRPVTLDEYQHRTILQPYQLMANGMRDGNVASNDQDRYRLYEVPAMVDPDDAECQKGRMEAYTNEAHDPVRGQGLAHDGQAVRHRRSGGRRRSARRARIRRRWSWCRGRSGTTPTR